MGLVLEGLLEINKIINGFTSESFSLHKGESKRIKANGILVICSQYYNLYPSIAVISPATKNIEYIGGYKEYVDVNPEKPDVPLNKNDAFQKVQKRHVQEKR